jgi:hypothetical protein
MAELESYGHRAQPGARRESDQDLANAIADPDFAPLATAARADAEGVPVPAS